MKRLYVTRGMPTTEAGILTVGLGQVYASIGEVQPDGSIGMRLYYKPLVLLIWIGAARHGGGRRAVPDGPAPAHRRAGAREGRAATRGSGGVGRCASCSRSSRPLVFGSAAFAVQPDEVLKDPALERRAREISAGLRCLVCQNQSIDDSDAQLAKDLRLLVRERLVAGDTDEQVRDFLVQRYGEFVLLKPAFGAHTLLLWLTPALVLILGGIGAYAALRRRPQSATAALDADEERKLEELLKRDQV